MNKLTIKNAENPDGSRIGISLNDVRLFGVTDLVFRASVGSMPTVELSMGVEQIEIELDGVSTILDIEQLNGKRARVEGTKITIK